MYRGEVLLLVYNEIACQKSLPDFYNDIDYEDFVLPAPPETPVLVVKVKLVSRKHWA